MKLRHAAGGIALLGLCLALLGTAWCIATPSGSAWTLRRVERALAPSLTIARSDGSFWRGLTLKGVRYATADRSVRVALEQLELQLRLGALWRGALHVQGARLAGVEIALAEREPAARDLTEEDRGTDWLDPPIDLIVDRLELVDATLERPEQVPFTIERALLVGRWTHDALAIERLDLRSPEGHVQLTGRLETAGESYTGECRSALRWTIGDRTYAGALVLRARDAAVELRADLAQPVAARLSGRLEQSAMLPWRLVLEVPRFDPESADLDRIATSSVAATLRASGTRSQAQLAGELELDAETLQLESLQLALADEAIRIESLQLRRQGFAGALRGSGRVALDEAGRSLELDLDWDPLELPAAWVGRELHTQGSVNASVSEEAFDVRGELALGPPGRLARIELAMSGTLAQLELAQLNVRQPSGVLMVRGNVALQPRLGWRLTAVADDFDPGELLPQWPGRIDLSLATEGELVPEGPRATFDLARLDGTLRERPITGKGNVRVSTDRVLTGQLELGSGPSSVSIRGAAGEVMDATVELRIRSLADWLPETSGALQGSFALDGRWPELHIVGSASGSALAARGARVAELALDVDVTRPLDPSGSIDLRARGLSAGTIALDRLEAQIDGDAAAHRAKLAATGAPYAARLQLRGSRTEDVWTGEIQSLELSPRPNVSFRLRDPARVRLGPSGALSVSRSCLLHGDANVCIEGERANDELRLVYSADDLPIGLAQALAPGALPFAIDGLLSGRGDVRRTAAGLWYGSAQIRSPAATVDVPLDEDIDPDALETWLLYERLRIDVALRGTSGEASASAALMGGGALEGRIAVSGLDQAQRPLEGALDVTLPTLEPIALFTPRLAGLEGTVELSADVGGSLERPSLRTRAFLRELSAQIPDLGLRLEGGELEIEPVGSVLALRGSIRSGRGRLEVDGTWSAPATLNLELRGNDVLVSDLPSARVVVAPDLELTRDAGGMELTGDVLVSSARIDVRKLPQGRVPSVSPDVVVVDREAEDAAIDGLPLRARVDVELGDDVRVTGYGLEATLTGQLRVMESPGLPTRASGEVLANGVYQAYGQDLRIERGRILFAASPIGNPQLDLTAVRKIEDVVAGLRITGSARQPQVEVFSRPPMGQADALAYLVAGKPLEAVGSGPGAEQSDMLDAAARSLGVAAGSLIAERIGSRLGLDQVGIVKSDVLGGEAFTIGEYLSPRLYLGYGVGLFESGDIITLRYRLTDELAIEAVRGPEDTRAGFELRFER